MTTQALTCNDDCALPHGDDWFRQKRRELGKHAGERPRHGLPQVSYAVKITVDDNIDAEIADGIADLEAFLAAEADAPVTA